ncbi:MAG: hydantoinase B/oxoprolinase family protein [Lewinellaceae bacterium]|nr:hydantoinase B/oxoprolinase family protein [Phaeodactylibacter sp.]MCB9347109.1 hydantoinase B/oxoprolinase family protein [Lewinellaceae bacterium]
MSNLPLPWRLCIDTGGTFTDCIATGPGGQTQRIKVLSSSRLRGQLTEKMEDGWFRMRHNWPVAEAIFKDYSLYLLHNPSEPLRVLDTRLEQNSIRLSGDITLSGPAAFEITAGEEAPILAARLATATPLAQPLPSIRMRLGSTKGTNALLERKGAEVALLITKGLGDLLYIGTQQRPHLFQLDIPEPPRLYHTVIEVSERLDNQGRVLEPMNAQEIGHIVKAVRQSGCRTVAIALLHAYRNPVHELQLGEALRQAGIHFLSLSQQLTPSIKLLPRAQTALTNAYLSPAIHDYLSHIRERLGKGQLRIMTSAGGLVGADLFHPKDSLLSGPAGGVVGSAAIAQQLGFSKALTLDMGGTSTDAARYDGQYDYEYTTRVGDVSMLSPCLAIETVAAGGGSICSFDGQKLTVGPESAGAAPGPACYGAGGPLAITDINLLLGKLDPAVMGIPISLEKARQALLGVKEAIEAATGETHTEEELLRGFEQIANEKMAEAIRRISVAKGFDPADYALLAFGGAGGLHACKIAELLNIVTIILPYDGGLLSAYGMGQAQVERIAEQPILQLLNDCQAELPALIQELNHKAIQQLQQEGFPPEETEIRHIWAYLRFKGQDSTLEVEYHSPEQLEGHFREHYERLFGHWPDGRAIELESLKVVAASRKEPAGKTAAPQQTYRPEAQGQARAARSGVAPSPVFYWDELREGAVIDGPALLLNPSSTAFIEPGWRLLMYEGKNAILESRKGKSRQAQNLKEAVELELFTNRFSAIAEEMGAQLQRTAFSVNVKERLDFSCALLGPDAKLLVNAPHIPVHLGSLGICARLALEKLELRPGDVIITNHPKYGGSHLPDVTLLSGIFTNDNQLIGYAINRAHHAEIGGKRPGSMPPDATNLAEEGVAIPPTYLVNGGIVHWETARALFTEAPYPTRALEENLADINAALAALRTGETALQRLVNIHGMEKVHYYMGQLKALAADSLQEALLPWRDCVFEAEERMDDGRPIRVKIAIREEGVMIDFTGTGPPHPHNLNANISIVYSAVIYVLRLLCRKEIPLNEGLMQRVQIELPESFLHPPFEDDASRCPAVVGGNTEVSQRLVDTLIKAFGLAACSQGTMNNFLFGNARFGYYETIGGGAGAGAGFHGRSAVHQHMTNTRITDPEELELRYPVRLHRFSRRANSGGQGQYRGGEGIIRELEFLEPMEVTILSQHRVEQPYGMEGGEPGMAGKQYLIRNNGEIKPLQGVDSIEARPGDRIVIETPGGGGWGEPDIRNPHGAAL